MQRTKIRYLTHTWNPIAMRCTPCSAGCLNCWHLRMCNRLSNNLKIDVRHRYAYAGLTVPQLIQRELEAPLKVKKPARIGAQLMGDLFHESVPFDFVDQVFSVFNMCPQHTFLVLTKRPARMLEWYNQVDISGWGSGDYLTNTWLGVTVCNQSEADEKIPILLKIPAAVKWVSLEPMLAPIDFDKSCTRRTCWREGLGWVVLGGETGPRARPIYPRWVQSVRDQCQVAAVPFFFKVWGEYCAPSQMPAETFDRWDYLHGTEGWDCDDPKRWRVGKKSADRLLDGRLWEEYPE